MSEIYQTPQSELTEATAATTEGGSVEQALAGNYSIQVGQVLGQAWGLVNGTKWKFQLAIGLYFVLYIVFLLIVGGLFSALGLRNELAAELQELPSMLQIFIGGGLIETLILTVLTIPPWIGVAVLGIRRAANGPIRARDILQQYKQIVPLSITFILMYLLMVIGFLLLIIPGIYLAVAYSMACFLVVDKKLSPWQALETSRKAVTKRWFSLFGLYVVLTLIMMVSMIPLGIGLIWTIPLYFIGFGVAYHTMFGCEPETRDAQYGS